MDGNILAIVPCLNEARHLPRLLRQLASEPLCSRIVVADGGSTDGSREIVQAMRHLFPKIDLMDNPKLIQSAGVNLAVEKFGANYAFFVRLDAHCRYPHGYIRTLVESAKATKSDSVVVPMLTSGTQGFSKAAAAAQNSRLGNGGAAHRNLGEGGFVDHGHHALMRIAAFEKVGGYDENMPCNEDAELDMRLASIDAAIWLEPKAAIIYFPRESPIALWRQYFRYGRGRAQTAIRHRSPLRIRQLVPLMVPPAILLALLSPLGWICLALPALGWTSICQLWALNLAARRRDLMMAFSGAAAMIMHTAWSFGFIWEWLANSMSKRSQTSTGMPSEQKSF
ncbi:glycosyltransferase family 2 protein [Qipengyuania seohaensis]|uniref:glycosyltransferase family 2 protein n=1 Tax=Qipengyuania seohaensis TaxID=266951 RepID=UPI000C2248F5|nr:glycosyltransferase family 2 protein [Qipengyuania seohaensis]